MSEDQRSASSAPSGDASRRTRLANERTQLAWWRTGLTALAVGLAIGRVLPELAADLE
jgi:putative membrane protein